MIHTIVVAAIAVAVAATAVVGQPASPVRSTASHPTGTSTGSLTGLWAVVPVGHRTVSHCVLGLRSDAAAPQPGKPQVMISADDSFAILRVRAAEWSFNAGRDVAVTLATAGGSERQPRAMVRGADLIDIAFGAEDERMVELAASSHLDIKAEGATVRLPLNGLVQALPAYRDCLASIGKPQPQVHASIAR